LPDLKQNIQNLFNEYDLKMVFDKASQSLKVLKMRQEDLFLLPYHSIADTLRRIIFFKTAIASNENSILLLEEPESHAFPPYMVEITQELIHSKNNQFFITTHSPFIVNDLLENAIDDLAIFIVDYQNHQTIVKGLTENELLEVYKYGIDLFMNYQIYL
jgi:predicted ATP-dependent endonuclease of OLD family